ncbi:MAG TPA: SgcJ/EcaC family oxidoreductase [Pyrinomonadaceae bacterium]|nr:SgcJ/EcaC family oxidoreductase [Pyrinomonadaceae bacterium]
MRKRFIAVALLTASLIPVFGQGKTGQQAPKAADEAAVRSLVQKCVEGWNKGSGEAFAAQFAEDSDYVVVNGIHLKGRRQNASGHQQIFDTIYKGTRLWVRVKSVRFLRPDVALIHTASKVLKRGESGASPEPEAIQTWTVSKHGKEWLVDAFHNTPIQRQGGQTSKP